MGSCRDHALLSDMDVVDAASGNVNPCFMSLCKLQSMHSP